MKKTIKVHDSNGLISDKCFEIPCATDVKPDDLAYLPEGSIEIPCNQHDTNVITCALPLVLEIYCRL